MKSIDCFCEEGQTPPCPPCVVAMATQMRLEHYDNLSLSMLKRRIPGISGREAAVLVEATRNIRRVA